MEWYWWLVIAAAVWVGLLVLALAFIAGASRASTLLDPPE